MKATNSLEGLWIQIVFVVSLSVCLLVIVSHKLRQVFHYYTTNFEVLKSGALCFINVCADDNVANKEGDSSAEPSPPPTIAHLHNRSSDIRT